MKCRADRAAARNVTSKREQEITLHYDVIFELWDAELGLSLGRFDSEDQALAEVRRLCQQSAGSRAPLGLIREGQTLIATGDALIARALTAVSRA